eukprot:CAMPEP_0201943528 /NCGR_PEP_ID=MMETSP0903-20130614/51286_1 /ASSEMBLY_ACC=CAM_ASM_000552 /TAXON_ID=420261 /ORGANISM="Thalassiosira antarctica, Strain CCMP982" /LENGTH=56 /DNA_ID=CAMNT_0048486235 /DNA_START=173 /DNA_END=339 /DNA_ORIENTATION=+
MNNMLGLVANSKASSGKMTYFLTIPRISELESLTFILLFLSSAIILSDMFPTQALL